MTVTRLRPYPDPGQLAALYPAPHNHWIYGRGHFERVEATINLAATTVGSPTHHIGPIADLSCGNGHIARTLQPDATKRHLGDYAGAEIFAGENGYIGPLEETIQAIPPVHVYVLSETLEHVDDPAAVLQAIRPMTSWLVLSTPLECWEDTNAEHLWAWDRDGVEQLLIECGFRPEAFTSVDSRTYGEPYLYGIWVAR